MSRRNPLPRYRRLPNPPPAYLFPSPDRSVMETEEYRALQEPEEFASSYQFEIYKAGEDVARTVLDFLGGYIGDPWHPYSGDILTCFLPPTLDPRHANTYRWVLQVVSVEFHRRDQANADR